MSYQIITDSCCDFTEALYTKHDVLCVPEHPENPYEDGSPSRVYRFDTSK